jgi:single-stranded-DNA-specific exonuclease
MYSQEVLPERNELAFFDLLKKIAQEVKKRDDFVVVFHYDADGCAAGAIATKALNRAGKKVATLCLKQLYKENIPQIKELGKNYLFVDFGSGQMDYLKEEFKENFFVLDHHQPTQVNGKQVEHAFHANPLLFGINGGTEISGAGVTFLFAKELDENNSDLSVLAIVGACGDMQDSTGQLIGMNRKIIEVAEAQKLLSVKKDLRLFGRISRPLVSFLCFSSNPILPGLTANEENCLAFLKGLGLPIKDPFTERYVSYEDLSFEQKRSLSSALIMHLSSYGVEEWKIKELIGEVYTLEKEKEKSPLRDAKEFATALNSAGRHKEPNVALNVCIGDRNPTGEYGRILALLDEHRAALRNGIEFIHSHGIEERKTFYFFDAKDQIEESLVGIIAGMLYGSVIQENKPIIALAQNADGTVKASGRGTSFLLRRGLNIGRALKEISVEIPGVEGGGHKIAAGAKIPSEKIDEFLNLLEKKFEEQMGIL